DGSGQLGCGSFDSAAESPLPGRPASRVVERVNGRNFTALDERARRYQQLRRFAYDEADLDEHAGIKVGRVLRQVDAGSERIRLRRRLGKDRDVLGRNALAVDVDGGFAQSANAFYDALRQVDGDTQVLQRQSAHQRRPGEHAFADLD